MLHAPSAYSIQDLRSGNEAAWKEFYTESYPKLVSYAQKRLPTDDDAADAVAEALSRTVASITRASEVTLTPIAWSFGILRHVVVDAQRKIYKQRDLPLTAEITPQSALEAVLLSEEHAQLKDSFSKLTAAEQELIELRVVAGLSSAETAAILGLIPGTVRQIQARALKKIRNDLLNKEELAMGVTK